MNALFAPGAKWNRLLVAAGLALLVASPAMLLWASRPARQDGSQGMAASVELAFQQHDARLEEKLDGASPTLTERPEGLSPLGRQFLQPSLNGQGNKKGLLLTNLGHLDAKSPQGLLGRVPPGLLLQPNEVSATSCGSTSGRFTSTVLTSMWRWARFSRSFVSLSTSWPFLPMIMPTRAE